MNDPGFLNNITDLDDSDKILIDEIFQEKVAPKLFKPVCPNDISNTHFINMPLHHIILFSLLILFNPFFALICKPVFL